MFRKILVPTDGSRYSDRAARYAADIARTAADAAPPVVTVLLVSDVQAVRDASLPDTLRTQMEAAVREADETLLGRTAAVFQASGVSVTTKRVEGASPAPAIAQEAESGGYDLIVMGSRGLGLRDEEADFLGSVTERVLRRVACPVLVVQD